MLQRSPRLDTTTRTASRSTLTMWLLMAADFVTVIWMDAFGPWLDQTSRFTATATLGGRHVIVLAFAAAGFLLLATLAFLTDGFTTTTRSLTLLRTLACVISVVALAGLSAFLLAALVARLLFGKLRP